MPTENSNEIVLSSPAKINLLLAVTGKRPDNYHNLISLVAPLKFGDTLRMTPRVTEKTDRLECDYPQLDCGDQNLILRAVAEYRVKNPLPYGLNINLKKRIPVGSGLGGGSSNAVATLRGLNILAETSLGDDELMEISVNLGSDCPLFLYNEPLIIRGRGEILQTLPADVISDMSGHSILLFRPDYSIGTAWAYRQYTKNGNQLFSTESKIESKLKNWIDNKKDIKEILYSDMERIVFDKHLDLPIVIEKIRTDFNLPCQLSGSGSACFAILSEDSPRELIFDYIRSVWGDSTFIVESSII